MAEFLVFHFQKKQEFFSSQSYLDRPWGPSRILPIWYMRLEGKAAGS